MNAVKIALIIILLVLLLASIITMIVLYMKSANGANGNGGGIPITHLPQVEQVLSQFSKTDLTTQKTDLDSQIQAINSNISELEAKLNPQDPLNATYINQINSYKTTRDQLDIAVSRIEAMIEILDQIEDFDSKVVPLVNSYNPIADKSTTEATLLKNQIDALTSTIDTLIANLKGIQ